MKTYPVLIAFSLLLTGSVQGQAFTSYFSGNPHDVSPQPKGGICLMGGSTESDAAMRWFLERANGGDILVLRASGSDGYNPYFFKELGVPVNSVESLVFHSAEASQDPYIHDKIARAEAIWIAGGDQWNYVSFWRDSPIDSLINQALTTRNIVIGGTSAGMAILGGFYFSARHDTVTSNNALENPYDTRVAVDSAAFIHLPVLANVITDTHYANRNRQGRHVTFLARILADYGTRANGIGADETIAVCIDPEGIGTVFGIDPLSGNKAYFIQSQGTRPNTCAPDTPLDWNPNQKALKVYAVPGTPEGMGRFNLNDWATATGGAWETWYVAEGVLHMNPDN